MRVPLSQSLWLAPVTQPAVPRGAADKSGIGRETNGSEDVLEGTYSRYGSQDANLPSHIGKAFMHTLLWLVETVFDQISGIDFVEQMYIDFVHL